MDMVLVLVLPLGVLVILSSVLVLVVTSRRAVPLERVRRQAIAALCARRGLVPGVAFGDFAILGSINPRAFSNSFSAPDHSVAVADFCRPAGNNMQFFSLLAFTVTGVNVPYVAVTLRALTGPTLGGPPAVELESIEFDQHFTVKTKDRRSAVMLLDPGIMQLVLDCEDVSFAMAGDKVLAFINRAAEPAHQPAEPVEFELLFKFWDGFVARLPGVLRSEYPAAPSKAS